MENWIDIAVVGIFALSIALGIWRGFFSALFGITALVVAFFAAKQYAPLLTPFLNDNLGETPLATGVSYVLMFVIAFLPVTALLSLLHRLLRKIDLSGFNAVGGGVFGFMRGFLYASLFVLLLSLVAVNKTDHWENAHTVPYIGKGVAVVVAVPPLDRYRGWLQFDPQGRPSVINLPVADESPNEEKPADERTDEQNLPAPEESTDERTGGQNLPAPSPNELNDAQMKALEALLKDISPADDR